MTDDGELSLEQIREFLKSSGAMEFGGQDRKEIYGWLGGLLCRHEYWVRKKEDKGLLRQYAEKVSGMSRAQITRLIGRYKREGRLEAKPYRRHRFGSGYTRGEVELPALVDEAHETLSGPATRRILGREFIVFGRKPYERLAKISVAHLYSSRKRREYREKCLHYSKTRSTQVAIGQRRRLLAGGHGAPGRRPGGQGVVRRQRR